jgi:hypothetical protein
MKLGKGELQSMGNSRHNKCSNPIKRGSNLLQATSGLQGSQEKQNHTEAKTCPSSSGDDADHVSPGTML